MSLDLQKLAELIESYFKEALKEPIYRYGLPQRKGTSDKVASGSLYDSVRAIPGIGEIGIEMNSYGKFVQSGRFPGKKGVPVDALVAWIKDRGLRPDQGQTIRGMAFGIQKHIKKYGIPAQPGWFDVAIDKIYESEEINEVLGDITVDELIDNLTGI